MAEFNVDRWGKWDQLTPREKLVVSKILRKAFTKSGSINTVIWTPLALQLIEALDLHDIVTDEDMKIAERLMNV